MSLSFGGQSRPLSLLALACLAMIAAGAGCKSSSKSGSTPDSGTASGGSGGKGSAGSSGGGGAKSGGTGGASGKGGAGSGGTGACASNAGGPVSGDADMHCIDSSGNEIKQATSEASCKLQDGQVPDEGDGGMAEQAPVLYGSEADDDDCKYHVKWTVSCVEENKDVTFNATITKKADGKPLENADPDLEVYLTDTHPAPNTTQKPKETAPGVYTAGPVRFDASGKWTVRFHLREECVDLNPDSPHGHVAFYLNVP